MPFPVCVRLVVEAHPLRLQQVLWAHKAARPEGWVHNAARLQSPLIFKECIVHLVGKFHLTDRLREEFLRSREHGDVESRCQEGEGVEGQEASC